MYFSQTTEYEIFYWKVIGRMSIPCTCKEFAFQTKTNFRETWKEPRCNVIFLCLCFPYNTNSVGSLILTFFIEARVKHLLGRCFRIIALSIVAACSEANYALLPSYVWAWYIYMVVWRLRQVAGTTFDMVHACSLSPFSELERTCNLNLSIRTR